MTVEQAVDLIDSVQYVAGLLAVIVFAVAVKGGPNL